MGIHCKILWPFLHEMFIIGVRLNTLTWRMQAAVLMKNNGDLLLFVTQGCFAYLLPNAIKTRPRSLCGTPDVSNPEQCILSDSVVAPGNS